jgi:hypothetical protein
MDDVGGNRFDRDDNWKYNRSVVYDLVRSYWVRWHNFKLEIKND